VTTGGTGGTGVVTGGTGGTGVVTGGTGGTEASGGTGNTGPVCPKPEGEICHEFIANDNSRNVVNYVNEFTGATWTAPVGVAGVNSPRSIEIVDNPNAQSGKAVMVSTHYGYAEFDLVDGTKLIAPTTNTVTAAVTDHTNQRRLGRLPPAGRDDRAWHQQQGPHHQRLGCARARVQPAKRRQPARHHAQPRHG
jgi:hypothetical protein